MGSAGGGTRAVVGVAGSLLVLAIAQAAVVVLGLATDDRLDLPEAWDERILDLVDFVEQERGRPFIHPVHVELLHDDEFAAWLRGQHEHHGIQPLPEEELEQLGAELRALGLLEGDLEGHHDLDEAGTGLLGVYTHAERRIRIRGTSLDAGVRAVVVHELTHAWQDQHADLSRLEGIEDREAASAFLAVVEGDAVRVEERFVELVLDPEERAAYERHTGRDQGATAEGAHHGEDLDVLGIFAGSAPYVLGPGFVELLHAEGGPSRIDAALVDPPSLEHHVLDPLAHLAGVAPVPVELGIDEGELLDGASSFGPLQWLLVLGQHLDPFDTLDVLDGWAGDRYGAFEREGRVCVRAVVAGVDQRSQAALEGAIERWAAAMAEAATAVPVEVRGHPGLESCDPGADTDLVVTDASLEALHWAGQRSRCVAAAFDQGTPPTERCRAPGFLVPYSIAGDHGPVGLFCGQVAEVGERLEEVFAALSEDRFAELPELLRSSAAELRGIDPVTDLLGAWLPFSDALHRAGDLIEELPVRGDPPQLWVRSVEEHVRFDRAMHDLATREHQVRDQLHETCGWIGDDPAT